MNEQNLYDSDSYSLESVLAMNNQYSHPGEYQGTSDMAPLASECFRGISL